MAVPPFRGNTFGHSGDWHGQLTHALDIAAQSTSIPEVREAVRNLQELLSQVDECKHFVSTTAEIPNGVDPEFVLDCARDLIKPLGGVAKLGQSPSITLEISGRGTREFVQCLAQELLSRAIATAQFIMNDETSPAIRKG